jgi:hypothetical protein
MELMSWDWPMDRIKRNAAFMGSDFTRMGVDKIRALIVQMMQVGLGGHSVG